MDELAKIENQNSWIGEEHQLLYVLDCFGAEKDEEGSFKIYDKPVVKGLDGSVVVHGGCKCIIAGKPVPVTGLLKQTSYGLNVTVIGVSANGD